MSIQTNNNYLVLYLSWLTKTIVALHKLINNKIAIKEEENLAKEQDKKKEKEKKQVKTNEEKKEEEKNKEEEKEEKNLSEEGKKDKEETNEQKIIYENLDYFFSFLKIPFQEDNHVLVGYFYKIFVQ